MAVGLYMDHHVSRPITTGLRLRVYAHLLQVSIGGCIRDLELIATVSDPADLRDRVIFLPL